MAGRWCGEGAKMQELLQRKSGEDGGARVRGVCALG